MRLTVILIGIVFTILFLYFSDLMQQTNSDPMYFIKVDNSRIATVSAFASIILILYGTKSKRIEFFVLAAYLLLYGISCLYPFSPTENHIIFYNAVRGLRFYVLGLILMYICLEKLWQRIFGS
jgi:hypothetical protein